MWNFKEGFTDAENAANAQMVRAALEGLKGLVPEVIDIKVRINKLEYSTKDIMLDSTFADEAAFLAYMDNADHKAAGAIVREALDNREAFDFSE